MNRPCVPILLIGFCILVGGCSEYHLFGNDSGIVWVMYSKTVLSEDHIPIDAVNEFLLQEGYTSEVVETWYRESGQSVQKIYLGVDIDPSHLLNGLRSLPEVLLADLDMDTDELRETPPDGHLLERDVD